MMNTAITPKYHDLRMYRELISDIEASSEIWARKVHLRKAARKAQLLLVDAV